MRTVIDDQPYWHLTLSCPRCGGKGMVPWDRLQADRRLQCRGCGNWYRLSGQANLVPADAPKEKINLSVRSSFSAWKNHQRVGRFAPRSLADPRFWRELMIACLVRLLAGGWTLRVAVAGPAIVTLAWLGLRSGPAPAETPAERITAAERAPIFAKAWACRDFTTMAQFTLPREADQLREWVIAVKRPPALLDAEAGEVTATTVSVVPQADPHHAAVTVRVAGRLPSGKPGGVSSDYQQREIWIDRDGKWFFSPKETVASLPTDPGIPYDPPNLLPISPLSRRQ